MAMWYLVLIGVNSGQLEALREYERLARPVMERHGGRFERIMRPASGADAGFDEVHLLRFEDVAGFEAFRADPALADARALREQAVREARLIPVTDVGLESYFGT